MSTALASGETRVALGCLARLVKYDVIYKRFLSTLLPIVLQNENRLGTRKGSENQSSTKSLEHKSPDILAFQSFDNLKATIH